MDFKNNENDFFWKFQINPRAITDPFYIVLHIYRIFIILLHIMWQ